MLLSYNYIIVSVGIIIHINFINKGIDISIETGIMIMLALNDTEC